MVKNWTLKEWKLKNAISNTLKSIFLTGVEMLIADVLCSTGVSVNMLLLKKESVILMWLPEAEIDEKKEPR